MKHLVEWARLAGGYDDHGTSYDEVRLYLRL